MSLELELKVSFYAASPVQIEVDEIFFHLVILLKTFKSEQDPPTLDQSLKVQSHFNI